MLINSDQQLAKYQAVAKLSTEILWQLWQATQVGAVPLAIDALAEKLVRQHGCTPAFQGVGSKKNPYRHTTCIGVNDTVVHGIPTTTALQSGDVVKVDFGLISPEGFYTDHCFTKIVGEAAPEDVRLLKVARQGVANAARLAVAGKQVGDLGFAMQQSAEAAGFSTVKELVGHGIGYTMHDEPQIPAWGTPKKGLTLKRGQVLCVESQVIASPDDGVYLDDDGWTIKATTGAKAAMFECMVVVGEKKPTILTPNLDWPLQ